MTGGMPDCSAIVSINPVWPGKGPVPINPSLQRFRTTSAEVSLGEFLEHEPYERLTKMAQHARTNEAQFLEHLILRAEAIYNFQPPVLPPPRPWWKLWSKEEREPVLPPPRPWWKLWSKEEREPELPAIVGDLRR